MRVGGLVARWSMALVTAVTTVSTAAAQPAFTVATYNLRLDLASDGPNAWPHRKAAVKALLQRHTVDIVGTQEGLPHQIDDLEAMPGFARVGVGRDDGRRAGEHSAIFFRRARFALVGTGDFWLSETPDRPGKGWDARCCNRIASWARLRDLATGQVFVVASVHFDHEGAVARRESAHLMQQRLRAIAGEQPVLCLGDLNATPESEPVQIMLSGDWRDARTVSETPPAGPVGTFNGFRIDAPLRERIDYVFVSPHWRVRRYAALTDTVDGRYPSDHLPVLAEVEGRR